MTVLALTTISEVEESTGMTAVGVTEQNRWQAYIDSISSFVNGYVDDIFEEITDDVVRCQADYYGLIDLGGGPISDVTLVANWRTAAEVTYAYWNGIDQIQRLQPLQVVDVTYTHGWAVIPDDIAFMVRDLVAGVLQLNENGASGPIRSFTVGDVSEVYDISAGNSLAAVVVGAHTLARYCNGDYTLRLGQRMSPDISTLPIP